MLKKERRLLGSEDVQYNFLCGQPQWKWNMKTDYISAKATMSHIHCCHQYLDSNYFKWIKLTQHLWSTY